MHRTTGAAGEAPSSNPYRAALRRLRPSLGVAGLFSAAVNVLMLTGSIYMLQVYDRVLASGSIPTLQGLFAIVVVCYAFLGIYEFLRGRLLARVAVRLALDLGPRAFGRGIAAGAAQGPGGRLLRDLDTVRAFLSGPAVTGLFDAPWVPIYLAILFLVHPWFGWLTVAGAAVITGVALINRAVTSAPIGRAAALEAAEREFADQSRRGAEAIRAMGMEGPVTATWLDRHKTTLAAHQAGSDPAQAFSSGSRAFRMLLQSAILTLGAFLVLRQEITAGMIIASSIIAGRALAPVDQVIGQWRAIGRAADSHRRLIEAFDADPGEPETIDLPAPTGRITASRLTKFAPGQPGTDRPRILTQVSFELEPGDGLGVIGNSASGKSTLARLLVGAWRPDAGELRFDGATPQQWAPAALGREIGYLPQQVHMLPGTIRENIARFDPNARDVDVIAAARLTGVHDMILALPDGYATRIGGPDSPLSGGQVQRLGLARAIYHEPRIIVLDEPNSNLDVAGDDALTATIKTLRARGSTVIVMAHRPSAIAAVNKVLMLQQGTVVKFGPKDEVLSAVLQPGTHPAAQRPAAPAPARAVPP
ncbi:type I secretion system permease/ATPase, partial [Rhodovulum iodosum]